MTVPLPRSWVDVAAHLVDRHGFTQAYVDGLDAEEARRLHRWAHETGVYEGPHHRHDS